MCEEIKLRPQLLLGLAGINSFEGVTSAIKRGIPYESIRPILSFDIRHLLETPIDDLIKEQEKIADTIRQGFKNNLY